MAFTTPKTMSLKKITLVAHHFGLSGSAGLKQIAEKVSGSEVSKSESRKVIWRFYVSNINNLQENYNKKLKPSKSDLKQNKENYKSRQDFYISREWRSLRYEALRNSDGCCQCCGVKAGKGIVLHVDHIKPRSKYPDLELSLDNLQVLCEDCNLGKSNKWDDDWRTASN